MRSRISAAVGSDVKVIRLSTRSTDVSDSASRVPTAPRLKPGLPAALRATPPSLYDQNRVVLKS